MAMPLLSNSNSNPQLQYGATNNLRNNLPPRPNPTIGSDQTVTEIRKTFLTPKGERIESIIEYMPGRCDSSMPGVKVTELVMTREILKAKPASSTSTRENMFNFNTNDAICIRGPTTQTRALPARYRVNNPRTQVRHFPYPFHSLNPNRNVNMVHDSHQHVLSCTTGQNSSAQSPARFTVTPHGVGSSTTIPNSLINNLFVANDDMHSQDLRRGINNNIDEPNKIKNGVFEKATMVISNDHGDGGDDNDDIEVGDGKIHSLPHRKYGPYTCPRCMEMFPTSQCFAAHVTKHYRTDGKAKKWRRLMSNYKRTNYRLALSSYGLTLVPVMMGKLADKCHIQGLQQNQVAAPSGFSGIDVNVQRQNQNQVAPPLGFFGVHVKVEGQQQNQVTTPPGFSGVNVKVEPAQF